MLADDIHEGVTGQLVVGQDNLALTLLLLLHKCQQLAHIGETKKNSAVELQD